MLEKYGNPALDVCVEVIFTCCTRCIELPVTPLFHGFRDIMFEISTFYPYGLRIIALGGFSVRVRILRILYNGNVAWKFDFIEPSPYHGLHVFGLVFGMGEEPFPDRDVLIPEMPVVAEAHPVELYYINVIQGWVCQKVEKRLVIPDEQELVDVEETEPVVIVNIFVIALFISVLLYPVVLAGFCV